MTTILSQTERDQATNRLGGLLASENPEERAEGKRILEQAGDEHSTLTLLKEAIQIEQAPSDNREGALLILSATTTLLVVFTGAITTFTPRGSWLRWLFIILTLFTSVCGAVFALRHGRSRKMEAGTLRLIALRAQMVRYGEWRVGEDLVMMHWSRVPEGAVEEVLQRALTDWFARFAASNPNEVLPEWSNRLGKQARSLFRVQGWGKYRRVVPRGAFSDARADLLVTLFQHFMARPDYRTHQHQLVELAAQMEVTTENHAFVRDAARVFVYGANVPTSEPVAVTTPPTAQTVALPSVQTIGRRPNP